MGLPKLKKPSELREHLYGTLEEVCKGQRVVVSTKHGEVVMIQKGEYDLLLENLELLTEFEPPVKWNQLLDHQTVLKKIEKKLGLKRENSVDAKSRKRTG